MVSFSLVLPTYNERENLALLVARLAGVLQRYAHEIIVVDDDSPDRTWEEAERLRVSYPQLRVIRRVGERGLSSAVIRGFREAKGRLLGVMDADLQHDETILPKLVESLTDAEFAVASRAVEGGGVGKWSWQRRFKSWVATLLAQLVLNVPFSDPMSGYFTLRREVFAALDDGTLHPEGFKILLYLYLRACQCLGCEKIHVLEVGYIFRNRLHGQSKLTGRVAWEYLKMLYNLRRGALLPQRFIRFACVGALGAAVNCLMLLWLHQRLGLYYLLASVLSIETAICQNFVLNEVWTFRDQRRGPAISWWARLWKFQVVSFGGMGINLAILALLRGVMNLPLLLSNLIGIGVASTYNYVVNKLWTWKASTHHRGSEGGRFLRSGDLINSSARDEKYS
jgi:dolichol-phosphate mannosyltransferase